MSPLLDTTPVDVPTASRPAADPVLLATRVRELVADRGVTYSDGARERPWLLDPLPLRIEEPEWTGLAAGLMQRAELLDAVLTDLYGPRRLLRSGLVPPRVVLGHPGFLPAVDGVRLPGPRQLVLAATDLCRTPEGWRVVADRTQAPSGAGYAMEDRRIVSQVDPDSYREAGVHRVGPYFQALRAALVAAAPAGAVEPRVAILSAGPRSETAFDQAFCGAHLGIPVVEGRDLVVREGRVWMRGLDEPEPVDVLWRRVDADCCDPLDLLRGSRLGVPGLVRAVRGGGVSVVNPLGSGVLESPALLAYLPAAARALRDEELALPSVPAYWCGDEAQRAHVLANLDRLVLQPTERTPSSRPVRGWTLTRAELETLAARVTAEPDRWVGQESPDRASSPAVTPDGVHERETVLRTFAVAQDAGYRLLTGGLALVSPTDVRGVVVASSAGAAAKDVWITSPPREADAPAALAWAELEDPAGADPGPRRAARPLSPRAAESMFWIGRYAERAARSVRLLRVVEDRRHDFQHRPGSPGATALDALAKVLDDETVPGGPRVLLGSPELPGTIASDVERLVSACFAVRDQLAGETWLVTASLERALDTTSPEHDDSSEPVPVHQVLDTLTEALLALAGIGAESLVRDLGWHLMETGRRLERALGLSRTLRAAVPRRAEPVDALVLESLLVAHDSVITYRRRYQARASLVSVLDLLLLDRTNPRSLAAQVDALRRSLAVLPGDPGSLETRARLLRDLDDILAEADTGALADDLAPSPGPVGGEPAPRARFGELLGSVLWRLEELADDTARLVAPPGTARGLDASVPHEPDAGAAVQGRSR